MLAIHASSVSRPMNRQRCLYARGGIVREDSRRRCGKFAWNCRPKRDRKRRTCTRLGSISQDPIGFAAGDVNQYRYVGNEVTRLTDPYGESPVGHHYFPLAELRKFFSAGRVSDAAARVAEGYYTGQTDPNHCFGKYGGISHAKYNKLVEERFEDYLRTLNKSSQGKVTADEMIDFINNHIRGRSAPKKIRDFNRAVEKLIKVKKNHVDPRTLTKRQLIDIGKQFRSNRSVFVSARLTGALALVGGLALQEAQGFADTCAQTPHVRNAYEAAIRGDLMGVDQALLGTRRGGKDGLWDALVVRGHEKAAAQFEIVMGSLIADIRMELLEPIKETDD
jgi:hypothetical protein